MRYLDVRLIYRDWEELKHQMIIEAVERYIYDMKQLNCTQAAIDVYTKLLEELENETV